MIDRSRPARAVIDLRQNGGGDFFEGREHLIEPIRKRPAINQKGRLLFVVVGRATFSAAMVNAIDFRKQTNAILVGGADRRMAYDGWGYSPLDQITPANVARLQPVWMIRHRAGQRSRGCADRQRRDVRLHAEQPGDRDRREDRHRALALSAPPPEGVVVHDDQPRRRALRRQGVSSPPAKRARRARREDRQARSGPRRSPTTSRATTSLAPLVADGKVMVGASGGEFGVRGFVAAFDPDTGKQAVAHLHGSGAGRARQRDVAEGATSGRPAAARCG